MKYVYNFEEGSIKMKDSLGGKGAGLAEMASIGLPVPPGFTITTEACAKFYELGMKYPEGLKESVEEHLKILEGKMGKKLGEEHNPLLVSVRSGAAISMPGMMDTILNLGLNKKSVVALATKTGNPRFAWDSLRRFCQMFGDVVMGIKHAKFEEILTHHKKANNITTDDKLSEDQLKAIVEDYLGLVKKETGKDFPMEPKEQLWMAIAAVFNSWNNDRAISYRKLNNIFGLKGTAVNVQSMVFGNMGSSSGTGVAFTRDPATGENVFWGEYLINAQGEDVVAGIRTPSPIKVMKDQLPETYKQLSDIRQKLEHHFKDMQDIEFTIENGKLFMLQTRNGKRTAQAAVRVAVELVSEKLLTKEEAVLKVEPQQIDQLLHKQLDINEKRKYKAIAKGLGASPGAAVGQLVFDAKTAKSWAELKKKVVLARRETSPEDIEGMNAAMGILTGRGGMTSHAAVVARGMGKCAVVGCGEINFEGTDEHTTGIEVGGKKYKEGDIITLDGATGEVFDVAIPTVEPELSGDFSTIMLWADEFKRLKVKANADTPQDAAIARKFGAEGIGLCRTEHMFFQKERISSMRKMILSETEESRKKYLDELLPYQKDDFKGLMKIMNTFPVIIRLLDPPLHEFLPQTEEAQKEISLKMGIDIAVIKKAVDDLHEFNPMLGFRGCRLGIKYPEITYMQAKAVFLAAMELKKEGLDPKPYIEVPIVAVLSEYMIIKKIIEQAAVDSGIKGIVNYKIGSMIEVPRAALTSDEIAPECDFFSFGTNDLTQMTCGLSRDDAGKFLPLYVNKGIYQIDPFVSIDKSGVGKLMKYCVDHCRPVNAHLEIGICGEHGGEPLSVEFCHSIGLDDVSCSPYRVVIARLAAAHAAIKEKMHKK